MENYTHEGNYKEPAVLLDAAAGLIKIAGRSIPERPIDFYGPIIKWIEEYAKQPVEQTIVEMKMEYYNSSTKKFLLDILRCVAPLHAAGKKVVFTWHYEEYDSEMEDAGVHYSELTGIPVNLVKYEESE